MTSLIRGGILFVTLAGVAATQEKASELYVQNTELGVEIRAPRSPGKDQLWVVDGKKGKFFDVGVQVSHKIDNFTIEAYTRRLGDPMKERWPDKMTEVSKNYRDSYLKERPDGTASNWKECRVIEEDAKAKIPSLSGKCCMHRINLIDQKDTKMEVMQYFCISSEVMYIVTVTYDAEGFKKYWPKEGQQIFASIKRCKYEKPK